jgi:hypothetical protein
MKKSIKELTGQLQITKVWGKDLTSLTGGGAGSSCSSEAYSCCDGAETCKDTAWSQTQ